MYTVQGKVNEVSHWEQQYEIVSKLTTKKSPLRIDLAYDSALGIYPKNCKLKYQGMLAHQYYCTTILYTKLWYQCTCSTTGKIEKEVLKKCVMYMHWTSLVRKGIRLFVCRKMAANGDNHIKQLI